MTKAITFNTTGHDDFIDFIKAYCILIVVFCHGFPYLKEIGYGIWGVQIPLFLLIQVFHCFKRDPKPINWRAVSRRVIIPFVVIELIVFGVFFISSWGQNSVRLLKEGIKGGGYGPGSYYPWVYLQMAILIPLLRPICERFGKWYSFFVFATISVAFELICSFINLPDYVYRLLCIRYVFLIWAGWIWVKEGVKFNIINITASVLSLGSIVYFYYYFNKLEPWFFNTGWTTHRWFCYFWTSFVFIGILYLLYKIIRKSEWLNKKYMQMASASYEIFLVQMAFYALLPYYNLDFISNRNVHFSIWFILAFVISIVGGIFFHKMGEIIKVRQSVRKI